MSCQGLLYGFTIMMIYCCVSPPAKHEKWMRCLPRWLAGGIKFIDPMGQWYFSESDAGMNALLIVTSVSALVNNLV